jgi:hypothetical protein
MALMMLLKKRPKKSVVPPSGGIRKTVNVPAKNHGAPSAHTIRYILERVGNSSSSTLGASNGLGGRQRVIATSRNVKKEMTFFLQRHFFS